MKHVYRSWLLLLCWGATLTVSIAAVTPPPPTETAPNNRVLAPRDGYYLVDKPQDCPIGGRYVFGSSILSKEETVLDQTDQRERKRLGQTNTHFVNGCYISPNSIPQTATWIYERKEDYELNHIVNDSTRLEMAVWSDKAKQTKDKVYDIFTVKYKKKETEIYRAVTFHPVPFDGVKYLTCDLPHWFGLFFCDDKYKQSSRLIEWTDDTSKDNFRSYYLSQTTRIKISIFPTRIFRYYAKGELLPEIYAASHKVSFDKAGYRTFYAPCAYTCPDDVKAYRGVVKGQNLELFPVGKNIPANTAVILYKSTAGDVTLHLTFEDIPRNSKQNDLWPTRRYITEEEAKGSYYQYYGLTPDDETQNTWCFAKINCAIPQGKAVLAFDKKIKSSVTPRLLNFIIHEEPVLTGLYEQTAAGTPKANQQMWDLQGRPLQHPRHGEPYIQGGKLKMGE